MAMTEVAPKIESTPEPFLQGSFALYSLPDGSLVISYRRKGAEASEQLHVPAYVMSMASSVSGGDPMAALMKMVGS